MRIDRLKIHKYKNLIDCEFDFSSSDGLLVIAGINGSGKSNLLEAILLIMKDIFSIPKPVNSDWPLYEISFVGKNESFSASRASIEDKSPCVVRKPINETGEVVHEQPSVVYMYSGEFNRLLNSRLGYSNAAEMPSGFYSITADDLNVVMLVLAMKSLRGAIRDAGRLITLPKVTSITLHCEGVVVDGEYGPDNELEDLSLWFSQQEEADGKICVHVEALSEKLAQLDVVDPRDQYYVLSQVLEEDGAHGFSGIDIGLELSPSVRMSVEDLSEGEKRLLLLRFVYEVFGEEESLILLDEPDAHIHEGRKIDLYTYIEKNARVQSNGRGVAMTICTSHSPTFINRLDIQSLIGLQLNESCVSVIPNNDFRVLKEICDDRMILFTVRSLLLFEGWSDVDLVKKAVSVFKRNKDGYQDVTINEDFMFCIIGGAGDAKYVYKQFRRMFPKQLIYMVFDNDKDGQDALKAVTSEDEGDECFKPLAHITDSCDKVASSKGGAFVLPGLDDAHGGKIITVEDYLSEAYIKREVESMVCTFSSFHKVVNIRKELKRRIARNVNDIEYVDMEGFAPLIDLLRKLPVA